MTLLTISRRKFESYFVQMVCGLRSEERERRENWQGADFVFFFDRTVMPPEFDNEITAWLTDQKMNHFVCRSSLYTFIELPSEADATVFWIRFKD